MRFWLTKNSELPIREQLVRQVLLGILSADLPAGHKLPSVRALARRHHVHANTVSAAYHDLLERGWLELRRGSGLYVRPQNFPTSNRRDGELDRLLGALLQAAGRQGFEPEEVLHRLEHRIRPSAYERVLVAEPEPEMRAILQAEIAEHVKVPVDGIGPADFSKAPMERTLVAALTGRASTVRSALPRGVPCVVLRLRSVGGSIEGQARPGPEAVISIVSRSAEIRYGSRAMLIAVGLDPDCLCEVDAASAGWQERLRLSTLVITDIVTVRELPAGCPARVFRVIADASIEELKQFCGSLH
jgi:DNA-binding transcriptional regulator YhcF (GntR family)